MILDVLKTLIPNGYLPWVLLLILMSWLGWKTNDLADSIQGHYRDTARTYNAVQQTCKAVSVLAHLSPEDCK